MKPLPRSVPQTAQRKLPGDMRTTMILRTLSAENASANVPVNAHAEIVPMAGIIPTTAQRLTDFFDKQKDSSRCWLR